MRSERSLPALGALVLLATPLMAQEAAVAPEGIQVAIEETPAAASQNPMPNLISGPLQNNTNRGVGPCDRIQNVLDIKLVIPIRLSDDWNLIRRFKRSRTVFATYRTYRCGGSSFRLDMSLCTLLLRTQALREEPRTGGWT
jgi:hypothetical protein